MQDKMKIGALDLRVDIGYAKEYMEAAWNILQQTQPRDFIISTGETHTIKELIDVAFKEVGLNPEGLVEIDPAFARPGKQVELVGNIIKAKQAFGFNPAIKFKELIKILIKHKQEEIGNTP